MSFLTGRFLVIITAIIVVVLLFFAPKKPSVQPVSKPPVTELKEDFKLLPDQQKMFDGLRLGFDNAANDADKKKALVAIAAFFEQNKKPLEVALYFQKLAEMQGTAQAWFEAGERFYRAVGFVEDGQVTAVYENAIDAYGKALLIDRENESTKIKMGVCYVEMGSDPMKGVGLLREVAEKNPKNIDAQLNLGFFSVKSKQFDRALIRFNNVLKIDTGYIDAYVYLAQTYEMMADTVNALSYYEIYQGRVKDTIISNEIGNYIKKLKGNKRN